MKTVKEVLREGKERLRPITGDETQAWLEAELLLGSVLKQERAWFVTHEGQTVTTTQLTRLEKLLVRREAHEPLAYLLGEVSFCERSFFVDRHTLIPRFETELIVDEACVRIGQDAANTLLWDVGTGSGALAVTLQATFPDLDVIASDISADALRMARKNARRLSKRQPRFIVGNLLNASIKDRLNHSNVDRLIVVANLPYLPLSDKKQLSLQVTKFEPASALFTGDDGRKLNEKLLKQLGAFQKKDLRPLTILMEFDPPQATKLKAYAKQFFKNVKILTDSCGRKRVLVVEA